MKINDRISYIEASHNPLSADVGIVKEGNGIFLYDVGNGDVPLSELDGTYDVVLSHFHPDHIGNIGKVGVRNLYLSKETFRHLPKDMPEEVNIHIVTEPVTVGSLSIFPIPSSHAKGSLVLDVDGEYAFVGDALYAASSKIGYAHNAQILEEEIKVLKSLDASLLLVSHFKGLVRRKEEVIEELEKILKRREKGNPLIPVS